MKNTSTTVNNGEEETPCGTLSFSLAVNSSCDCRKAGILLALEAADYQKLKSLIEKTDEVIDELQSREQMKRMSFFME